MCFDCDACRSTQAPDGTWHPEDIPPAQMIRELQPNARFIIVLSDPVKRLYSDYYFLSDNLKPVAVNKRDGNEEEVSGKSPAEFHDRVVSQIAQFNDCVAYYSKSLVEESTQAAGNHADSGSNRGMVE